MSTITFNGVTYDRDSLPEAIVDFIETYQTTTNLPTQKTPDDTDFSFRMNQALQMFGEPLVIANIQALIDNS